MLPENGIGLSPDENTVYAARRRRRGCGRSNCPRPAKSSRDTLYIAAKRQADCGARRLSDFELARGRSLRQCLRGDADLGLYLVIAPDGTLDQKVPTGDRMTTNMVSGGPDMKTAYVPLSGRGQLIAMENWTRPGLKLNFLNK